MNLREIKNISRSLTIVVSLFLSVTIFDGRVWALAVETHRAINEHIAKGVFLDDYLQKQLGLQGGIENSFNQKKVWEILGDGGEYEDDFGRYLNHFYNPFNNKGWGIFFSAKDWATTPIGNQYEDGQYSWFDARDYYWKALTSINKDDREKYFAETFRAIGQVMHLVQDMSVPAHVRNDAHPIGDSYEEWRRDSEESQPVSKYPIYHYTPFNSSFLIPQLFDIDKYISSSSNPADTLYNYIGLAEYTNANFYSNDTLNAENFRYPKSDVNQKYIKPFTGPLGTYKREYYYKDCNEVEIPYCNTNTGIGKGYKGYLLRAVDLNVYWINKIGNPDNPNPEIPILDENVHFDYSQLLTPRAIGYSSQVLKYFFRGQIEVKCIPVIIENKISYVKLSIKNKTLNEAMTNGKLILTGKYIDSSNEEKIVRVYYWNQSEGTSSDYAVIESLEYGQPLDLNFLFPEGTQIPVDKRDSIKLILTYKGKLGDEEGAVIGKVFDPGVSFNEEFNTAPKGDYKWFQMDSPVFGTNICPYHNMEHGIAQNEIIGGKLIKTNIRYPITNPSGLYPGAHLNRSLIGVHNLSGDTYANNIFPIPVTKDTYIEFKIDDMTISPLTAASGSYTHYQGMVLSFNNGYNLEFSLNNQYWYVNNTTGYFTFNAGNKILSNIHKMFEQYNLPVPADFKLNYIGFFQQIGSDLPLDTQYEQHMTVDFIRIVEMENTGY